MVNYPQQGKEYTAEEVFKLDLDDTPHLGFQHEGLPAIIQNSHITVEELLSVPGLAQTKWRYVFTTNEWVPIFEAVDVTEVLKCVDIVPWKCCFDDPHWWVTPKGFPREQHVWEF